MNPPNPNVSPKKRCFPNTSTHNYCRVRKTPPKNSLLLWIGSVLVCSYSHGGIRQVSSFSPSWSGSTSNQRILSSPEQHNTVCWSSTQPQPSIASQKKPPVEKAAAAAAAAATATAPNEEEQRSNIRQLSKNTRPSLRKLHNELKSLQHDPQMAEMILFQHITKSSTTNILLNYTISFNIVLNLYVQNQMPLAAEQLLLRSALHSRRTDASINAFINPDIISLNTVLKGYLQQAQSKKRDVKHREAALRAESILCYMLHNTDADDARENEALEKTMPSAEDRTQWEEFSNAMTNIHPDLISFNTVVFAWSKISNDERQSRDSVRHAERVLNWMDHAIAWDNDTTTNESEECTEEDVPKIAKKGVEANAFTYNCVMHTWSNCRKPGAAQRTEYLLRQMCDLAIRNRNTTVGLPPMDTSNNPRKSKLRVDDPSLEPDKYTFCTALRAWAKSSDRKHGATNAERVLAKMQSLYHSDPIHNHLFKPNQVAYNIVLNAHAHSSEDGSAERAERMLNRMLDKQTSKTELEFPEAGTSSDTVSFDDGIQPGRITFNTVLDAYAKSARTGSAGKAKALLDRMIVLRDSGVIDFSPCETSYNTVINAYAKAAFRGEDGSAESARAILMELLDSQPPEGDDETDAPNPNDVLPKTDAVVQPNTITFNAVLGALANGASEESAIAAEELLETLLSTYRSACLNNGRTAARRVQPLTISFNTVINAWARSSSPLAVDRSEEILNLMQELRADGTLPHLKPDVVTLASMLNVISRSDRRKIGSVSHAKALYDDLIETHNIRPNVLAMNTLIKVCANCAKSDVTERQLGFSIAQEVYEHVLQSATLKQDSFTYACFIKACNLVSPINQLEERRELVKGAFERCCEDGLLHRKVLCPLQQACTSDLYVELLGDYLINEKDVDMSKVPKSWVRKVKRYNS